ncbi:P-selectin-like [Ptychodera flava]|uniref:P-selectin-like n=1 Tax=Ptychodera flava TaxID=63121 RepID=UPI00396A2A8C
MTLMSPPGQLCRAVVVVDEYSSCPNSYGNHCYEKLSGVTTWPAALSVCQQYGVGQLLDITTSAEKNHVKNTVLTAGDVLWIGQHDLITEGSYRTVVNRDMPVTNFLSGQPDDDNLPPQDCIVMQAPDGTFRDEYCFDLYGSICKRRSDNTCDQVFAPLNGQITANNPFPAQPSETVSFTCDSGYFVDGPATITCSPGGYWEELPPLCIDSPASPATTSIPPIGSPITTPAAATQTPATGQHDLITEGSYRTVVNRDMPVTNFLSGQPDDDNSPPQDCVVMQGVDGHFRDEYCFDLYGSLCKRRSDNTCDQVFAPLNGQITANNPFPAQPSETVSFTCDSGYFVDGPATITCSPGGYWEELPPLCIGCPTAVVFENHCYEKLYVPTTWPTALSVCQQYGVGHLLDISSGTERNHVRDQVLTAGDEFWIGQNDFVTEGSFRTVMNNNMPVTNFVDGQPDDDDSPPQDCIVMRAPDGKFRDEYCYDSYGVLCKRRVAFRANRLVLFDYTDNTCDEVFAPLNGQITSSNPFPAQACETVSFSCNSGFTIDGPETITCSAGGYWEQLPPLCTGLIDLQNASSHSD